MKDRKRFLVCALILCGSTLFTQSPVHGSDRQTSAAVSDQRDTRRNNVPPTAVSPTVTREALVSMSLGPASERPPKTDDDWLSGLTIDRFLPANGQNARVTPTWVSLLWDRTALYVRFRCADPDPVYRDGVRLPRTDRVEVGLSFTATQQDLWQISADASGSTSLSHAGKAIKLADTSVKMDAPGWTAELTVPWDRLGGLPSKQFQLQLSRVREITAEFLSPSAVDYHDGPVTTLLAPAAVDGFVETTLGGKQELHTAGFGLITLPSGIQRWERRAELPHITNAERKEIAQLQKDLTAKPTTQANLAERVRLAELWYDLLDEEGFRFQYGVGGWVWPESYPWVVRHKFNDALRQGDVTEACLVIDSLLQHFSQISATWFADGSPGDVREDAWSPVSVIDSAAIVKNELVLRARAGNKSIDLKVSFPSVGGVRIYGPNKGYFAPTSLLGIQLTRTANGVRASANKLTVEVGLKRAWYIEVKSAGSSEPAWRLHAGDLLIHQGAKGEIAGVDIRGELTTAEKIFGLGERFDSLDQRGKTLTLWQIDAWDAPSLSGLGNQSYKPIPLWHGTSGYSVFWNTSYQLRADFGKERKDRYRVTAHGPIFDLYVWPGRYEDVLREYAALTGKPLLPPAWVFEPWMGGGHRRWDSETGKTPPQAMLDVVAHFDRLDIPHSSIYAEGPSMIDPTLYRELEPKDIHMLAWGRSQPFGWSMDQIKQAIPDLPADKLPLMKLPDRTVYGLQPQTPISRQFPYFDFTDPKSMDLLRAYWKSALDLGVSGTMVDFGDLVPREALFHDGTNGEQMHNWYVHDYNHAVHQVFQERRGDDFILFARGAAPGTQVDAGQMSGDHKSNFRGLEESLTGGLSLSSSGFSNWGSDLGGLVGKPDEEVYLRWVEFATFSPLMRSHGTTPREPWYYSDAAVVTYKKYAWLRENLLPYIYGSAQGANATGIPLMRALPAVAADEYMFGDDLLVSPVHSPGERRAVTLPEGAWADFWTGAPVAAGEHNLSVSLDQIPVFVRAGALIPIQVAPDLQLGESMSSGRVPAVIVTPPISKATVRNWRLPGSAKMAHLESRPDDKGFTVTIKDWHELQYLCISGLRDKFTGIAVNGEALPHLDMAQAESFPPGWIERGDNRLIVRLPASINNVVSFSIKRPSN